MFGRDLRFTSGFESKVLKIRKPYQQITNILTRCNTSKAPDINKVFKEWCKNFHHVEPRQTAKL